MKLLHEILRLRAAGRGLFAGRRATRRVSYAVTVPQPLESPVSEPAATGHRPSREAPSSSRQLCLLSSH